MKKFHLTCLIVLTVFSAKAQKSITVKKIYVDGIFQSRTVSGIRWMNDGRYYSAMSNNQIVEYDVTTGLPVETIVDGNTLRQQFNISDYSFSRDERKVLILTDRQAIYRRSYTAMTYLYDRDTKSLRPLSGDRQAYATFSPDGTKVAYTKNNDLYYISLSDWAETRVTSDGKPNQIINGSTDWVYEEELSFTKAFFWSPDSKKLAYYRFDETQVPEYTLQRWHQGKLYPENYQYKYPKAGEKNSVVDIYIYQLENKERVKADIGQETDIYIPRVIWTPNPEILSIRKMNRLQNRLDILHIDADTGKGKTILTESSDTYVDVELTDDLTYLNDGQHILLSSEKDGYKHLYLYTIDGKLVRQITKGEWEVVDFLGIDQSSKRQTIYFTSHEDSPLEKQFYSISLDGKKKKKLSSEPGINTINISGDFKYYINFHSDASHPTKVTLIQTSGNKQVKVLEDNKALSDTTRTYGLVPKEFFTFKTVEGTELNGYMLKPADFNSSKKYPVLMYQYSGPGSQSVLNNWGGSSYYWHQMLTQKGYIIAVIDGRGTGGRGTAFKKMTYKQLGRYEVVDQIAGAKYLASLPYTDPARIGIWGWSFGGYMSSLAILKGSDVFSTALAVAPVTSWRYYDTIYTERYLSTPQLNPEGYDANSPTSYADRLKGKFLIIHGTGDDNVHFQNSIALVDALIAQGKQFQSFYYPDRTHGIYEHGARPHLFEMMTNFILNNL